MSDPFDGISTFQWQFNGSTRDALQHAQDGQQAAFDPHGLSVDPAAILAAHTPRTKPLFDQQGQRGWTNVCAVCRAEWRGDAETGGCEARLLALEVVRLRAEWEDREEYVHLCVKQYSAEVSGPNLAEAEARATVAENAEATRLIQLEELQDRVALLEGLLRDLIARGETMKATFFTGNDTDEAIACMEWDVVVETAASAVEAATP